jgi:hypothetical protein
MAAFNKAEFWRELDATDEDFILKKYAAGGYSPARHRAVTEWIKLRAERKREDREAVQHRVLVGSAKAQTYAIVIGAVFTAVGVVWGYVFK